MNPEIIRVEFDADGHPEETVLLLAMEGELSAQNADQVAAHTRTCLLCQTRMAEVEQGFAVYEEFRNTVLLPEVQPAAHSFREFPARLKEVSGERPSKTGAWKRTRDFWRRLLRGGAAVRWVSVTAAVMVVAFLVTQTLLNPVRLSAAELLERAAAFQNPSSVQTTGGRAKKARQRVRISSGGAAVVRDFQWTVGTPIPNARWQDETDPGKWNAPLTADGFSQWRNSVSQKYDQLKRAGGDWTVDTTTSGNAIREAWIVVRASDFHPTEQHIRFSDDRSLDFEELTFDVADDQAVKSPTNEAQNVAAQQQPANRPEPPAHQAADPNEAEFEIRYLMFQKEWDLGEDLEIARTGGIVSVKGAASSQERAQALREALGQIAGLRVDISSPPVSQAGKPATVGNPPASTNPSALLKETLEKGMPIPEQRHDFVDRCLAASDNAMAHASAILKLAERYDEPNEAALTVNSRARLREILRVHLERLSIADAELDPLIQLLSGPATGRAAAGTANWRETVQVLFKRIREQDSVVTALVAGSRTVNLDVASASGRMKFAHESIHGLLLNAQSQLSASGVAK
jgi:hypothetical protein